MIAQAFACGRAMCATLRILAELLVRPHTFPENQPLNRLGIRSRWNVTVLEARNRIGGRVWTVRGGDRALYYWLHPNFMINWYDGKMDTNLVLPLGLDRTEVIFDFYFADVSEAARDHNLASIDVGNIIQDEDMAICKSVQRGLNSRAYSTGRLSVRREAGEHLFHRLLHAELSAGLEPPATPSASDAPRLVRA